MDLCSLITSVDVVPTFHAARYMYAPGYGHGIRTISCDYSIKICLSCGLVFTGGPAGRTFISGALYTGNQWDLINAPDNITNASRISIGQSKENARLFKSLRDFQPLNYRNIVSVVIASKQMNGVDVNCFRYHDRVINISYPRDYDVAFSAPIKISASVKNHAPLNLCANRLTEDRKKKKKKKMTPDETRDRQTLSKSPCQLSRVLSTLSGILRFREILES
ncbi:hypothetical protein PUN28_010575 [Cardiocondyla obscurior]|uniref:LAGLIDADG homing endonuclease n=1 Tax=Cardiocondyla obscurior TaxID=286306 RepID=A0AAW2FI13_9HYME